MTSSAQRTWFAVCRALGLALRRSRYSSVVVTHSEKIVRKRRAFYAPLLIALGKPLMWLLDTGVKVLPQWEWEARERELYAHFYGLPVRSEQDGSLVLPLLPGLTLAELLDDHTTERTHRFRIIALATSALHELHERGFTHGDAMAENVLVHADSNGARWFDFETVHESARSINWRRADDLRALIATVLLRVGSADVREYLAVLLNAYPSVEVRQLLPSLFTVSWQRRLVFHLGQAPLSFRQFSEIAEGLRHQASGAGKIA